MPNGSETEDAKIIRDRWRRQGTKQRLNTLDEHIQRVETYPLFA